MWVRVGREKRTLMMRALAWFGQKVAGKEFKNFLMETEGIAEGKITVENRFIGLPVTGIGSPPIDNPLIHYTQVIHFTRPYEYIIGLSGLPLWNNLLKLGELWAKHFEGKPVTLIQLIRSCRVDLIAAWCSKFDPKPLPDALILGELCLRCKHALKSVREVRTSQTKGRSRISLYYHEYKYEACPFSEAFKMAIAEVKTGLKNSRFQLSKKQWNFYRACERERLKVYLVKVTILSLDGDYEVRIEPLLYPRQAQDDAQS